MLTAFAQHGIDHLSASSLNTYASEPALWVLERLLKRSAPVGAAAHRGSAVEKGVDAGLLQPEMPVTECQDIALRHFDSLTPFSSDPKKDAERAAIAPSVAMALFELRQYGTPAPEEMQKKIEVPLGEHLPPLWGYQDYGWPDHGITLDLKTQLRLSHESKIGHERQVAGYVFGTNRQGRICYTTPKKVGVYIVENVPQRFAELRMIAVRLGRFLMLSRDPEELAGLLVPNCEDFRWNNPIAQANRVAVYGL